MPTCMRYAQPMTDELFREDAALDTCDARITILGEAGIELDRTVFYPQGAVRPATAARYEWPTAACS